MPNPINFNMPNQPPIKPGSMMYGGFTPPYQMPGYSPTDMSGFLNAGGSPTFSNAWTAHMLRPQDIKPRVQQQFNGVTPQQMMSARNGFRASLGMGPVQQRPLTPPVMGNPAGGPMQPAGPNLHPVEKPPITPVPMPGRAAPIGNYTPAAYQSQPQFEPSQQGLNTFKSVMGGGQMPAGPGGRLPSEYMMGGGQMSLPPEGPARMIPPADNTGHNESSVPYREQAGSAAGGSPWTTRFSVPETFTRYPTSMKPVGANESILPNNEYSPSLPSPNGTNRQWTPSEIAQMQSMERQHQNMKLRDQNLPRWQGNVSEINRQADVMERRQLPDVNDPNWKPNDWKDNMADIPGSMWGQYRDRFNAINRNRQQPQTPQEAMLSATPTPAKWTHNYQSELAQADPNFDVNNPQSEINKPAYYPNAEGQVVRRQRITPMPRTDTPLTDVEANRMNAVGSSIGEWNAKVEFMKRKYPGYEGDMTPEMSQAYADERQAKAMDRNARAWDAQRRHNAVVDQRRERKLQQRMQNFQYQNPELFSNMNPNAVQFLGMANGANLNRFTPNGLTPQEQFQQQMMQQQLDIQRAGLTDDPVLKEKLIGGGMDYGMPYGGNQPVNVLDGSSPAVNPYRRSTPGQIGPPVSSRSSLLNARGMMGEDGNVNQGVAMSSLSALGGNPPPQVLNANGFTVPLLMQMHDNAKRMWGGTTKNYQLQQIEAALKAHGYDPSKLNQIESSFPDNATNLAF